MRVGGRERENNQDFGRVKKLNSRDIKILFFYFLLTLAKKILFLLTVCFVPSAVK